MQAQAAVSSDALVVPGLAPAAVRVRDVAVSADRGRCADLHTANGNGGSLTGNAAIDLRAGTLGGQFSLDAPDASKLLTVIPDAARITGPISASAPYSVASRQPEVDASSRPCADHCRPNRR